MKTSKIHQGQNIKRFRKILGIKQHTLATDLGTSQQTIAQLEQQEAIDQQILEKIAIALKIPTDAIKNFTEEATYNIISNTFNSNGSSTLNAINYNPIFNPVEKWMEALEENKKLYERLLQSEKEKVDLLQTQATIVHRP